MKQIINNFRLRVFVGLIALVTFWFLIFYPVILPEMYALNLHPLLATIIFELLFFATLYLLSLLILGEYKKHTLKIAMVLFTISHIYDSFEPPFILNVNGTWDLSSTSYLISWDYGISYALTNLFHIIGPALYYITNLGFVLLLILITIFVIKPQVLGKVVRKYL